ncbi:MAG TPA: OsmC family protein [Candidatus Limnocylindrales bacterium]|nr:OsmC family protein [Candidatus Limnocylindrales bacterium]
MSREEIGTKIQGAVEYLTANPAEARYTDSPATARLADPGELQVTVEGPDGATLATDMPASVGGANSAASPGWFLRAAAAACVATLIGMRAAHVGIGLDSVEVTVDSESDDRGILGIDDGIPAGPLSTRVAIRVSSASADRATIEEVCRWAVDHCPVTDAMRREVPLTVEVA